MPKTKKAPSLLSTILERVDQTHNELTDIRKSVGSLAETAVEHNVILEEHIRRTEVNENNLRLLEERFAPVERHISMWAGAGKVLAIVGLLASLAATLYKILSDSGVLN